MVLPESTKVSTLTFGYIESDYSITKLNLLAFPRNENPICEVTGARATVQLATKHHTLYYSSSTLAEQSWNAIIRKIIHVLPYVFKTSTSMGTSDEREEYSQQIKQYKIQIASFCISEAAQHLSTQNYAYVLAPAILALKYLKEINGYKSISLVEPYLLLGQSKVYLNEIKTAEEYYAYARWIVLNDIKCPDNLRANVHFLIGQLHEYKEDYLNTKNEYAQAIYYLSKYFDPKSVFLTEYYYKLSNIFYIENHMEVCHRFYDMILDIWLEYILQLQTSLFRGSLDTSTTTYISTAPITSTTYKHNMNNNNSNNNTSMNINYNTTTNEDMYRSSYPPPPGIPHIPPSNLLTAGMSEDLIKQGSIHLSTILTLRMEYYPPSNTHSESHATATTSSGENTVTKTTVTHIKIGEILYVLGLYDYLLVGDRDKAIECLNQALVIYQEYISLQSTSAITSTTPIIPTSTNNTNNNSSNSSNEGDKYTRQYNDLRQLVSLLTGVDTSTTTNNDTNDIRNTDIIQSETVVYQSSLETTTTLSSYHHEPKDTTEVVQDSLVALTTDIHVGDCAQTTLENLYPTTGNTSVADNVELSYIVGSISEETNMTNTDNNLNDSINHIEDTNASKEIQTIVDHFMDHVVNEIIQTTISEETSLYTCMETQDSITSLLPPLSTDHPITNNNQSVQSSPIDHLNVGSSNITGRDDNTKKEELSMIVKHMADTFIYTIFHLVQDEYIKTIVSSSSASGVAVAGVVVASSEYNDISSIDNTNINTNNSSNKEYDQVKEEKEKEKEKDKDDIIQDVSHQIPLTQENIVKKELEVVSNREDLLELLDSTNTVSSGVIDSSSIPVYNLPVEKADIINNLSILDKNHFETDQILLLPTQKETTLCQQLQSEIETDSIEKDVRDSISQILSAIETQLIETDLI